MTPLICGAIPSEILTLPNAIPLGVGLVQAAATLSKILEREKVSHILFTGTCGALFSHPMPIGTIVRAKTIHLGDWALLSGDSFLPEMIPSQVRLTPFLKSGDGATECDVFCPLSITKTEKGAKMLEKNFPSGIVENLEAFAVAQLAQERHVPCEIILGVSNQIGPMGHDEWYRHHSEVSQTTRAWITKNVFEIR